MSKKQLLSLSLRRGICDHHKREEVEYPYNNLDCNLKKLPAKINKHIGIVCLLKPVSFFSSVEELVHKTVIILRNCCQQNEQNSDAQKHKAYKTHCNFAVAFGKSHSLSVIILRVCSAKFYHMFVVFGIHPIEQSEEYHRDEKYLPMDIAHNKAS